MTSFRGSMKTKSSAFLIIFFAVVAVSFFLPELVSAQVNSTLYIQGPGGSVLVNTSIAVPESCTVVDSVGVPHDFSGHRAPCAIKAAKDAGVIADFLFTNDPSWGLFLKSINGIADGPAPDYPYWNLWKNGIFSEVGVEGIILSAGDDFQLTYGPYITGIISIPQKAQGGPVITDIYPNRLRVEDAISFLVANQKDDGSFGSPLLTDWVAVALGAYKGNNASVFYARNKLVEWMEDNSISEGALTDFERRAMALMALGINPYTGTSINYIQAILDRFDGEQFGDANLVNDDIFALLVLLKAGYQENEEPVASALQFVLGSQRENGSWGDADMSAAAIQMLDLVLPVKERDEAIAKATAYLEEKQESTGGFGNVYSTSWVLQAIAATQGNGDSWIIDNRTPEHFLALRQALDGGLLQLESKENRIWATSYAIPAVLGQSWGSVLYQFEKPAQVQAQTLAPSLVEVDGKVLEGIGQEVARITKEVATLNAEVLAFTTLARMEKALERIALETKAVQIGIVQLKIQQIAKGAEQPAAEALARTQEPASPAGGPSQVLSQDLSGIVLLPEDEDSVAPYGAGVGESVGVQGLSSQLVILLVIIGAAIFAFSGGVNNALSILRRTFSRV